MATERDKLSLKFSSGYAYLCDHARPDDPMCALGMGRGETPGFS